MRVGFNGGPSVPEFIAITWVALQHIVGAFPVPIDLEDARQDFGGQLAKLRLLVNESPGVHRDAINNIVYATYKMQVIWDLAQLMTSDHNAGNFQNPWRESALVLLMAETQGSLRTAHNMICGNDEH